MTTKGRLGRPFVFVVRGNIRTPDWPPAGRGSVFGCDADWTEMKQ